MKWLLVILLLLSGCATFTHRDINIYDRQTGVMTVESETRFVVENVIGVFGFEQNRTSPMQIKTKELIDYVISKLGHEELFKGYDFVFMSGWLIQSGPNGNMVVGDGLTILEDKVIYLKIRGCFADSAILHEMSHVIHANGRGDGDQGHMDKVWWSVMSDMTDEMVKKFCPADYTRNDIPPSRIQKL